MLTVRASKKRRFFLRRDVILIRRRTQRRPRAAGTQSAHILLARSKKKIPSNETRVSSCLFYLRVVVSLRAYLLSADKWWPFYVLSFSRFFEVGFSLAENHRPRSLRSIFSFFLLGFLVKQRDAHSPWWTDNHEKKSRRTQNWNDVCYPKQQNFFFSVLSPSFFRPFLLALRKQHYRVCRECVYFKHITETIRLEKKKKKKRRSAE